MPGIWDWINRNASNISLTLLSVVVGVFASWYFFRRQREPKQLDYAFFAGQVLGVKGGSEIPDNLQLTWKEYADDSPSGREAFGLRPLQSAVIARIHVRNTGKKPVEDGDFKRPITIRLHEGDLL